MFQNKLTRAIFILMFLLLAVSIGYYIYSGGESIFPTISPTNNVPIPYMSQPAHDTTPIPQNTIQIRHTETPYNAVSTPDVDLNVLTTTPVPRSTPYDFNKFQEVIFINHTDRPVRVIIISPYYLDKTIENVLYLDLVYALHWIYIFVDNTVFVEQVINDRLYYVNIFEDKIVVGVYRLQP